MAERELVEEVSAELYGLPPDEFTGARDERAKALRADGEREAANAVKALRRPTVAAWALNQLSRRRRKELDELLAAGEELRAAQEELIGGGDRSAFQEAAAKERALVAKLSADAATLASEAGSGGAGAQEKIAETLHAAALDERTADELSAGRLVKEREAIGGFGELGGDAAVAAPRTSRKQAKRSQKAPKRDTQERDRQALTAARTDERHARRELEAAERAVQHAQERAEAAEAHAREANDRARVTAERLKEAKRAQTAARKAHARAERALERAESAGS